MRRVKKNIHFLLLLLLIACFVKSQTVNKQKLLRLQSNETYVQSFSEFINEPAIQFSVNPSDSYKIVQPYVPLITYQDSPPLLEILATFNYGPSTKFNIEIQQQTTSQQTIQLFLVYQQLSIDPSCSCVKQITFTPFLIDEVSSIPQQLYGSFFSYNQGFISYQLGTNIVKSFRFLINSQSSAQIIPLTGVQLYQHVAILGSNNSIYIIQYIENTEYWLIKFDSQFNSQILQKIGENCNSSFSLIDTGRYFFNYCRNLGENQIKTASVDFSSEKLILDAFPLTSNEFGIPLIKRVGNNILIGIMSSNSFSVHEINSNDGVINEPFSYSSYSIINQFLPRVDFVSSKLMVAYSKINNSIQLFDIKKQVAVYQIQVSMSGFVVKFVESLGNQIILYIYDSNDKYFTTIVAEVNMPSLLIQTTSSTTQPIQLSIQTVSSTTYKISINVQIVQQNTVLFAQSEAILENTFSNIKQENQFTIPIEDYIIGADLALKVQINQQAQGIIQNANLMKQFSMKGPSQMIIDESCTSHQTDGFFSSIFVCPTSISQQAYYLYAIYPFYMGSIGQSSANFLVYRSEIEFQYPLNQIDNQGSFTLKITPQSPSFYVYVPFIRDTVGGQLQFNNLPVNCSENNFLFASDPAYSVLFTFCGQNIVQQFYRPYKTNGIAQIVSTTVISSNSQQITNLICIQGLLFMYNSTIIQAYDYINFGFIGYINVPTLVQGTIQQLTLFKNSFLITVISNPLTTIAQYSYNGFKTNTPTFMRNLQIDSDHPVSSQGIIIPKRQTENEFAYVLSTKTDIYYMYRINSKQWSNQLYTTLTFNPSQAVVASNLLYVMNPESYTGILPEASILCQIGLNETEFTSTLSHIAQIQISLMDSSKQSKSQLKLLKEQQIKRITQNSGQKLLQETSSLLITNVINRDASTQYGVVNNQASTLNQVRTQIQDTNYVSGQVFYFEDWQTFNACLLGWQSDSISEVVQRMSNTNMPQQNQAFTIQYKYNATIEQNQIKSVFFTIQGQFNGCAVLDDNGSFQIDQQQNYQFQLYIVCINQIKQYQINYQYNQTSGLIINTGVSAPNIYQLNQQIPIPQIQRIISANNQLNLYYKGQAQISLITLDNISKQANIIQQKYSYYSQNSIYFLFQFNLQVTIYPTGIIQSQVRSTENIDVYDLATLLQQFNFILPEKQFILSIEQYTDTQFRIAIENNYIYDVTFLLNSSGQLVISQAYQYYYQDAFPNYISGFKGSKYTLFFGYYSDTLQKIALYSNSIQQQGIFLIQSTIEQSQKSMLYPQCIWEINSNLIQVQYSNGILEQISISDNLGIKIFFNKSSVLNTVQTNIAPIGQQDPNNLITFAFQGSSTNNSFGIISLFTIINLINIIIYLF
ncbi:transmembrane protein, putative (macronuclear) [Tetrahymena thermophila SB210]|uniref:Transmembrane protein, putative n=1 Tax=Tetrahymena thermophila (strain SB210) TaxID=312017 RepID=Q22PB8_TETTS|nr:transmembrane protein, putative [Tetrahymena thermophila SB210]EAR87191.1 transmembrane protein, putative [Tetrahymena thermophila SB210]|eukprot:XP_001007436.1 transmembrane protein, putative [Tetrahymena thermophila SB210]